MRPSASLRLAFLLANLFGLSACSSGPGVTSSGEGRLPACLISVPGGWQPAGSDVLVLVGTEFDHADIHYTLDGTEPVRSSSRYNGWGIHVFVDTGARVTLTVRAWAGSDSTPCTRATYHN